MAATSGTVTRYGRKGLRESLHDVIYNISPTNTPFMTGAGRGAKAVQTLEEWQTDSLAAVDGSNAVIEGNEASYSTPAATVRVGNYTQISDKTAAISGTAEMISKAGRKSEMALQIMKRGKELKRDQETIFLRAQAGDAGGTGTARTLAGLNAWVKTNVSKHSGGGNPTYSSGVPSAVRTDGTQRAFTETLLKVVLQSGYTEGAEFSTLMVGAWVKGVASSMAGTVTQNYDLSNVAPKPTAVIASVDVYVGEFDTIRIIPNRFQRGRDAWLMDWDQVEVCYLRPHQTIKMAKDGDAEKRLMIVEYTLKVKNEAGLGLVADCSTS